MCKIQELKSLIAYSMYYKIHLYEYNHLIINELYIVGIVYFTLVHFVITYIKNYGISENVRFTYRSL